MIRVPDSRFGEVIGEGLARLPSGMRRRVAHVHFFCGTDPLFAGLHAFTDTDGGRPYSEVAHCCYPGHLLGPADRRATTVVLPDLPDPSTVVHELGHALHHSIGFSHTPHAVTEYAATNDYEAFAEALVAWTHYYGDQDVLMRDKPTLALFAALAA